MWIMQYFCLVFKIFWREHCWESGELYNYVVICNVNIGWIKYTANTNELVTNAFNAKIPVDLQVH